ncbi:MAG: acyl carrier protein [Gammaproteobacteria bacterium]|jgi:acyl carrier protein
MGTVEEKVKKIRQVIVEELGVDESKVVPEASFVEDLGADSLDHVQLVMELEHQFGIDIPDEDAQKIYKVQDIIDYVTSKEEA